MSASPRECYHRPPESIPDVEGRLGVLCLESMCNPETPQEVSLFIDWLGLSLRVRSDPLPIQGHTWAEYSSTNVWARRRILWTDHGDRVCTLLSEPHSSTIPSNAALLEIDNEWLYHGGGTDRILSLLMGSFYYEISGISRLDLAVDFCPTVAQKECIEGLASGSMYVGGKRNGSGFWSVNHNEHLHADWLNRKIPHCQSWGHKTSAVKWKLYYKTKELWDDGGGKFMMKPYIVDQWRLAGMDVSNVWRLEVSMKHLNDYSLYGDRVTLDVVRQAREQLFLSLYNTRFQVRKNEGHSDKSNDTIVPFLPLRQGVKSFRSIEPVSTINHHGRITLLRHLVSSLDDEHVLLDDESRHGVFEHISQIVRRDNLESYFRAMTGRWLVDFIEDAELSAIEAFNKQHEHASALYMEKRGSNGATRRYDVPKEWGNSMMKPNATFEQYDEVTGEVIPQQQGKLMGDNPSEQLQFERTRWQSDGKVNNSQLRLLP